jgi:thioredoxin reductase (NADPH)
MTITHEVENYPGFADVIQGPWLMDQMQKQAENVGTQFVHDTIVKLDLSKRPFTAVGDTGDSYVADTLVIATGAQARWLNLPSEQAFKGMGVSACATCDGFFFRGKKVAVVGGGNTAVEEAIYLTNHAEKVTLIHRRDSFRAEKIMQERLFANPKIEVIWDTVVDEVLGAPPAGVTGLKLRNVKSGAISQLAVDGLFVAIGHTPNTALFKGLLDMDEEGYLVTKVGTTQTNIPGVYAAGDVQDKIYRQAVTAAGTGCMAALEVERYLTLNNKLATAAE